VTQPVWSCRDASPELSPSMAVQGPYSTGECVLRLISKASSPTAVTVLVWSCRDASPELQPPVPV
jgi:hypothetical protein